MPDIGNATSVVVNDGSSSGIPVDNGGGGGGAGRVPWGGRPELPAEDCVPLDALGHTPVPSGMAGEAFEVSGPEASAKFCSIAGGAVANGA